MDVSWLHEAACRQRTELWLAVGYKKLCVDKNLNCDREFFREVMFIPLPVLFVTVDYMNLCRQILEVWSNIGSLFLTVFKCRDIILSHSPLSFNPLYKTNTVAISEMTAFNEIFCC